MNKLRPGEKFQYEAFVLSTRPYEESHLLVTMLSRELGKFSAFARHARKSKRRFGASLEVASLVVAHGAVAKNENRSGVLNLDKTDLKEAHSGLRKDYFRIEAAMFALALIADQFPDGPVDEAIFWALGDYLNQLCLLEDKKQAECLKALIWSWLSHQGGYGFLIKQQESLQNPDSFKSYVESTDFERLKRLVERDGFWKQVYRLWSRRSGHQWNYWERYHAS